LSINQTSHFLYPEASLDLERDLAKDTAHIFREANLACLILAKFSGRALVGSKLSRWSSEGAGRATKFIGSAPSPLIFG
jgi:hypothetical protein